MREVYDFLKKHGPFYVATMDGDQPRVRPFGALDIFEDKLYIQTGHIKDVSKQMDINPKIELSAFDGERWLRVTATAVNDDRLSAKEHALESNPRLKNMYKADDANMQVLYLKDAVATFYSFTAEPVTVRF